MSLEESRNFLSLFWRQSYPETGYRQENEMTMKCNVPVTQQLFIWYLKQNGIRKRFSLSCVRNKYVIFSASGLEMHVIMSATGNVKVLLLNLFFLLLNSRTYCSCLACLVLSSVLGIFSSSR